MLKNFHEKTPQYFVQVIWEGCDVSDILSEIACMDWQDVRGMRALMSFADTASMSDGFSPKLGLRIHDAAGNEIKYIGSREGWELPVQEPLIE